MGVKKGKTPKQNENLIMIQKLKDTLNGIAIFAGVPVVMFAVLFIIPCYTVANGIPFLK